MVRCFTEQRTVFISFVTGASGNFVNFPVWIPTVTSFPRNDIET